VKVVWTPGPVSTSTRPGSGSVIVARAVWLRPASRIVKRISVPAPTPPFSTTSSVKAGGRKPSGRWCSW
jgi:hypothetical protein